MGMSDFYGARDQVEFVATINRALDLGVTFLDTADMYGVGTNEELVGRVVRARREWIVVATKFGNVSGADGSFQGVNGRSDYVRAACDASLKRTGLDIIDLYYQHCVGPAVSIEELVGAMAELVTPGKVKYLGLSEASPATIRRAHAVHPITVPQTEYSLWTRDVEDEILLTGRELGIGFVPYSPLGRGLLTGQFKSSDDLDQGDSHPRLQDEAFRHNLELVAAIWQRPAIRAVRRASSHLTLPARTVSLDVLTMLPG